MPRRTTILAGPAVIFLAILLVAQTAAAAAGDVDPSFSGNGISRFGPSDLDCCHAGVALQASGKIVIAAGYADRAIVLLRPNGKLDDTFGSGGITTFRFDDGSRDDFALDVAVAGGKILVAGYGDSAMGVARLLRDGTPDPTFAGDGIRSVRFPSSAAAEAVAIQPDGWIVLGGDTENGNFALARLRWNGSLDPSFGTSGRVVTDMGTSNDQALALWIQSDGRIVQAGEANGKFALARFTATGSPDPTFGTGGRVVTPLPGFAVATGLVEEDGVGIVAGGGFDDNFTLVRYDMYGAVDPTFGDGGVQTVDPNPNSTRGGAADLALAPDGSLVQVGPAGRHGAAVRYSADGIPDAEFGNGGTVLTSYNSDALAVAVQPDSKVVVLGEDDRPEGFIATRLLGA